MCKILCKSAGNCLLTFGAVACRPTDVAGALVHQQRCVGMIGVGGQSTAPLLPGVHFILVFHNALKSLFLTYSVDVCIALERVNPI